MDKRKKAIIVIAIILIIIIGVIALFLITRTLFNIAMNNFEDAINDKFFNKPNINDEALQYMEAKYGEHFDYAGPWGNSLTGTHELLVRCESLQEAILVEIENYRDTYNRVFKDNYLAVKYKQDMLEFLQESAEAKFNEANVYYEVIKSGLSTELQADATFQEYLENSNEWVTIMLEVKDTDYYSKKQVEELAELIANTGLEYYLTVVVMEDNIYGTYNRDKLNECIAQGEFKYCAKVTKLLDSDIDIRWLEAEK